MLKLGHALIVGNIALAAGLGWAAAKSQEQAAVFDVIQARQIELVNDQGKVVGQLYLDEIGGGQIRLRNSEGEVRVKLGPSSGGGADLILMDAATEPGVHLES